MNAHRSAALMMLITILLAATGVAAQDGDTPGLIAYVGADLNVYTTDLSGGEPTQLTNDAGLVTQDKIRMYLWPTWATDGRLAYFAAELERSGASRTEVLISPDGVESGTSAFTFENDGFTYAYWSPQNCDLDEICRDLAVLLTRQSAGGFVVELVRDLIDEDQHILTGNGAPFYFSWSPEGTRMFWHRNSSNLDVYTIADEEDVQALEDSPGLFAAPAWSPIDDRLLFASLNEDRTTTLIVSANDTVTPLASALLGPVAFAWSPDGSRIAYTDRYGALIVLDSTTGEEVIRSTAGGIYSFFWSPDSQKLAFITQAETGDSISAMGDADMRLASMIQAPTGIAWAVMNAVTGETRQFSGFIPTSQEVYLLTYFDQFSQSHQVWSPDSRYLVYGEQLSEDQSIISVLDTTQTVAVPFFVADGSIGIWSYR